MWADLLVIHIIEPNVAVVAVTVSAIAFCGQVTTQLYHCDTLRFVITLLFPLGPES
jgi:hypothetical protein